MYKQILLAYDGSEAGRRALFECADLSAMLKADLHLLAVTSTFADVVVAEGMNIQGIEKERQRFQDVLDEGLASLRACNYRVSGQLAQGDPVDEICARALDLKADLICVGHRHSNSWAQRWWRGSLGKTLMDHAPCSVLVVMTH